MTKSGGVNAPDAATLVDRLRNFEGEYHYPSGLLAEAAAEIEQLRQRLELHRIDETWDTEAQAVEIWRLRARLRELTNQQGGSMGEQGQGHSGEANTPLDGKAKVKDAMAKHTSKKDRYMAAMNGILDNAKTVVLSGITPTEMTSKIEELRGSLDEIWSEIHTHEK